MELPIRVYLDVLEMQNSNFLMEFNMQKFKFHVLPPLWRIFLQDFKFCSSIEKLWNFSRQLLLCSCVAQNWKSYKVFSPYKFQALNPAQSELCVDDTPTVCVLTVYPAALNPLE